LTRKYGQDNPPLTAILTITDTSNVSQNIPLRLDSIGRTTLTAAIKKKLDSLGLTNVILKTDATTYSDVGTYLIRFENNIPADSFLTIYTYKFTNATLTVEKLPLKITPVDKNVTEGQYIGNVTFNYDFINGSPANPDSVRKLIKIFHQGYVPNNVLAVIKNFLKTQADGSVLDTSDLRNLSMITSFKALKSSRKFLLSGNQLVPATNPNTFNLQYLLDVASESIYNYQTSPNKAPFFDSTAVVSAAGLSNDVDSVLINGSLQKIVNGSMEQTVPTSTGPMAPILNDYFVQVLNGELSPVPDGSLIQLANSSLIKLVNNDFQILTNGSLIKLVNGSLLKMVNGAVVNGDGTPILENVTDISAIPNGSLIKLVNGSLLKLVNGSLLKIVNGTFTDQQQILNGSLIKLVNGSLLKIVNGSLLGVGGTNNNTAVIVDQTDVDASQANWLGAMFGVNMITGLEPGTQWLVPGVLINSNFDISYGLGKVTINPDGCTVTHTPDKNFGSTSNPGTPTSLWLNIVTKISGQLKAKGDYLQFKSGSVTFNDIISKPLVSNLPIPDGRIEADNVSVPFTRYDAATNSWITKVPLNFSSTSDIFISGIIINSDTGFIKNNNANTVVKGKFFSNKNNLRDQWSYASAAYQPQFTYASVGDSGNVQTINGTYRAATPVTQIQHLVNGGSGGGGNNYSGSVGSYDKFTACVSTSPLARSINLAEPEIQNNSLKNKFQITPNPATNYINLSFVPAATGNYKIILFNIDGKKIFENYSGTLKAGSQYNQMMDVGKLVSGVYMIQLRSTDKVIVKKIIISR
jgi:hypothetical protein